MDALKSLVQPLVGGVGGSSVVDGMKLVVLGGTVETARRVASSGWSVPHSVCFLVDGTNHSSPTQYVHDDTPLPGHTSSTVSLSLPVPTLPHADSPVHLSILPYRPLLRRGLPLRLADALAVASPGVATFPRIRNHHPLLDARLRLSHS